MPKKGSRTSEFWLTLAAIVCATVLRVTGDITGDAWVTMVTAAAGLYTGARTLLKSKDNTPDEPVDGE